MLKMKTLLKNLSAVVLLVFVVANCFLLVETVSVSAATSTVNTSTTGAGAAVGLTYPVELTVTSELTLSCDTATSSMGSILGMSGGTAVSSRACVVKTNNYVGWTMTTKASTTPAMQNVATPAYSLPDAALTPASWSAPVASTSKFGFNVTGNHSNTGSANVLYAGFNGTTTIGIASSTLPTSVTGETINMNYKAEVGSSASQPTGLYRHWTTVTAYMN